MARPGVTYLEVASVAQQLATAGKNPTIDTIRLALGTGSNSTLGLHLKTWKERQSQTQQIASKEHLPEELIALIKGLWERVMGQAEEKVQAIQHESQQKQSNLTQECQRLQQENAQWQQHHQQIKGEKESTLYEKFAIEQLLASAQLELATLTEKLIRFEQQNHEKQSRIDDLSRHCQQNQANLEHYRTASAEQRLSDQQRYEQQQNQLEQTLEQLNQRLRKHQQENALLQKENQQVTWENNQLSTQLDTLTKQYESTAKQLTQTNKELAQQTQAHQYWEQQCQTRDAAYQEQQKCCVDLKTQQALLLQQIHITKQEANEWHEENKVLAHEKWILAQEKSQLQGQLKQWESQS